MEIFTLKQGINVLYPNQNIFWCLKFDSFKHYVCISLGVCDNRSLRGLGAEAGTWVPDSLWRIEHLGKIGPESQFSNHGHQVKFAQNYL